jgi:hypothetical protein
VEGTVRSFVTPTFDGSKVTVFSLRFDRDGNLWVGTANDGVFRVHGNAVDHYERTEGLSGDYVRAFFEDREGIVWAATNNGVDGFHDPLVTSFSAAEGLGADNAVGILASRDGTIWVANAYSLDRIVDGTVSSIRTGHGLPGQQVSSLVEDRAGNLWDLAEPSVPRVVARLREQYREEVEHARLLEARIGELKSAEEALSIEQRQRLASLQKIRDQMRAVVEQNATLEKQLAAEIARGEELKKKVDQAKQQYAAEEAKAAGKDGG